MTSSPEFPCGLHFGEEIRSLDVGTVRLAEVRYASRSRIPPHVHGRPHICVVLAGGYVEEIGRLRFDCGPASILYHAAGVVHANELPDGGTRCLTVGLDPGRLDSASVAARLGGSSAVHRGTPTRLALRLAEELTLHDDLSALVTEGLVMAILDELARGPRIDLGNEPPPWLARVHARLREEFRSSPTLAGLAAEAGVHRTHLARAFRQHFDCSVGEFIRQLRVESACRELRETRRPLASVAYGAGFADQSHMTRMFGRWVGVTPARYRRLAGALRAFNT